MDDFVMSNLTESRNEWITRLVSIMTPLVVEGVRSIYNEAWKLCADNEEPSKYLMTFQNLLSRIPKWNNIIVEEEKNRIVVRSGCNYLEDLITCVHIIQLKVLTCIRVGNKQKKIDISIPNLNVFIHKVYINVARKVYSNVYLFEKGVSALQGQRNNRELEIIIQESILITIRESIPTEAIIRAYMDETMETEETVLIEDVEEPVIAKVEEPTDIDEPKEANDDTVTETTNFPSVKDLDDKDVITKLTFNDVDTYIDEKMVPANDVFDLDKLDKLTTSNVIRKRLEEDDYERGDKLKIHADDVILNDIDFLGEKMVDLGEEDILLDDIEELGA
jgi:hypothetical protein